MKELKRVVFQYKIDGNVYSVRKPTVQQITELTKKQDAKKEDSEGVESSIEFLDTLGLPKEVGMSLEAHMIEEIVNDVSGSKKN